MNTIAILLTMYRCAAIDTASSYAYYATGAYRKATQADAVRQCERYEDPSDLGNCFQWGCKVVPAPKPPCTCNPAHTSCTCTVDPHPALGAAP